MPSSLQTAEAHVASAATILLQLGQGQIVYLRALFWVLEPTLRILELSLSRWALEVPTP